MNSELKTHKALAARTNSLMAVCGRLCPESDTLSARVKKQRLYGHNNERAAHFEGTKLAMNAGYSCEGVDAFLEVPDGMSDMEIYRPSCGQA